MNERAIAFVSGGSAVGSISLAHVNHVVSIAAAVAAILCALPVIVDRWGPRVRSWFRK